MLVLLYIIDSLRRDFLGCYGDAGAGTPHLDALAAAATRYTQAVAAAPWSKPSGAALLTGDWPRALRLRGLLDRLPPGIPTLAARLQASGWHTVAVSANPFISDDFGLLRGFAETVAAFLPGALPGETFRFHPNHFRRLADALSTEADALVLARSAALHHALLDALPPHGPTLALCWSMDAHAPFFVRGGRSRFGNPLDRVVPAADPEWLTRGLSVRDVISLYRDMIAYQDEQLGELVAALRARGQWDEALVIVTADHGEAFGEHGRMGHTHGLWEEQVAVPLLVKWPQQRAPAVVTTPVSLIDVATTVAEAAGSARPDDAPAVPLPRTDDEGDADRPLLLEDPDGWALRWRAWKAYAPTDETAPLLFNLHSDPHEQRPLRDEALRQAMVARATTLRAAADTRAARWPDAPSDPPDDAVLTRLRALGYL